MIWVRNKVLNFLETNVIKISVSFRSCGNRKNKEEKV